MYEDSEIMLDDTQNKEMCSIIVQSIGDDDLTNLNVDGKKHGVGKIMKDIWIMHAQQRRKQF